MYKIFETVDDVSRYTAQRLLNTIQPALADAFEAAFPMAKVVNFEGDA